MFVYLSESLPFPHEYKLTVSKIVSGVIVGYQIFTEWTNKWKKEPKGMVPTSGPTLSVGCNPPPPSFPHQLSPSTSGPSCLLTVNKQHGLLCHRRNRSQLEATSSPSLQIASLHPGPFRHPSRKHRGSVWPSTWASHVRNSGTCLILNSRPSLHDILPIHISICPCLSHHPPSSCYHLPLPPFHSQASH